MEVTNKSYHSATDRDDPAAALEEKLRLAEPYLRSIGDSAAGIRPSAGEWSVKEIIGHLIDSAANNHQRFVRLQKQSGLELPGYEQEHWVRSQAYADASWPAVMELWLAYNRHLAHVIRNIPKASLEHTCRIGGNEPVTLDYIVRDYVGHLEHHLEQARRASSAGR